MPSGLRSALDRIVGHMANLSPPRHRELVRGMVAELNSITEPAERTRFALGAIAAIARLAMRGYVRAAVRALVTLVGGTPEEDELDLGGPLMSKPTARQLLGRHAAPVVISLVSLTALLLGHNAVGLVAQLAERGAPPNTMIEAVLLAVPFTLALTIPMAVFLAVSWVFTRLGAEGVLARARRERHGIRRLLAPVLGAAAVIAALTFVSNSQVVPRANARLAAVLDGAPREASDRTMTIGQLREAAQSALTATEPNAAARAAAYEVEIQKKFALAAAIMIMALAAAAVPIRFSNVGPSLAFGVGGFVFVGYYLLLVAGESLAEQQAISPFVAMWMANAVLLTIGLLLVWRPSGADPTHRPETVVIGG